MVFLENPLEKSLKQFVEELLLNKSLNVFMILAKTLKEFLEQCLIFFDGVNYHTIEDSYLLEF